VPHGELALDLVADFLSCCGLRRSLCVLGPEAGLPSDGVDRRELRRKLGLLTADEDESVPVLSSMLTRNADRNVEDRRSFFGAPASPPHPQKNGQRKRMERDDSLEGEVDYEDEDFEEDKSDAVVSDLDLDDSLTDRAHFHGALTDVDGPAALDAAADLVESVPHSSS